MNAFISYALSLTFLISDLHAGDTAAEAKVEYRRLTTANDRERRIVEQLQAIQLEGVSITGLTPSAAIGALREKVLGAKGGGVINFTIRGSEAGQQVTIQKDKMTYAEAIDQICTQTGRMWRIEIDEQTGTATLVLKNQIIP